jgi:hypothetical protein
VEIEGAAYFYSLATVAMAFAAFSAIVVVIRQTFGAALTPFQLLLTRVLIEHGFLVALFSFLPMLLGLFEMPHKLIWQASSATAAAIIAYWQIDYAYRRYPAVRTKRHPTFAFVNWTITGCAVLILICNALGIPFSPQVSLYALSVSWILVQGGDVFLFSLGSFLHQTKPRLDASQAH